MKYSREDWPEPWAVPPTIDFIQERWDDYPRGGFIEDVILYQKGYETTNFLSFWAAVHYVSSIIMRDSELVWAHGGMYPNFYLMMVAPPSLVKKSTTIHGLEKVEDEAKNLLENKVIKFRKSAVIIRGKATPEAIFASMANEKISVELGKDSEDDPIIKSEEKNANLIIRVSELSTLLSSSKYNVALVDKLTDFYDCKDTDSDTTIGRGNIELKNVFCTLMGATTPDTLSSTIPKEAFGGGFISRSLLLREDYSERIFPEPIAWPDLPGTTELAERLAWIAQYKKGKFTLSKKAYLFYADWYKKEKLTLREAFINGEMNHENNRKDIHILKLAHIISLQRYDITNIITLEDIQFAMRIVERTIRGSRKLLANTVKTKDQVDEDYVLKFLATKKSIQRSKLISLVNYKGINANRLSEILDDLYQADKIEIFDGTRKKNTITKNKLETYKYKE